MSATVSKSSAAKARKPSALADREIVITRVLNAPRDLVWKAWTDPRHVVHWWGPTGFTNTLHEMDVRPGGVWRHVMHGPDGTDYPNKVVYLEVVKPERLVYSHGDDVEGHACQFHVTVTFAKQQGGKTKVTLRMLFETAAQRDETVKFGAVEGGNQTLDRLEAYVASMPASAASKEEIVITRVFDAPRQLVWKAWVDPEFLKKWSAPRGFDIIGGEQDVRPGGAWRCRMRSPGGQELSLGGAYREVAKPERLVFTHAWDDANGKPGPETLVAVRLADLDGKTQLTFHQSGFKSAASRDGHAQGWTECFDLLAECLAAA